MSLAVGNQDDFGDRLVRAGELSFRHITKAFELPAGRLSGSRRTVLNDISFTFPAGKIIGLVGRTGVGKTTLGRILGGLLCPDRGRVLMDGIDLFGCSAAETRMMRRWLRFVPQNPDAVLPAGITVAQALKDARKNSRLSSAESRRWQSVIQNTSLYDPAWASRPVGDLSLGQRRRVVNLRSLQSCPRFLILDEPFNGLDLVTKHDMLSLLQTVSRDELIGVFFISHDVAALERVCETIWNLESEKLTEYKG